MRFTEKDDFLGYTIPQTNAVGDKQINIALLGKSDNLDEASVTVICQNYIVGEPIRQFGRIEDVLEKHDVGSAEELDLILEGLAKVHQENANLKNELAELKQNAVVLPKELHIGCKIFWANEDGVYSGKLCAVTKDIKPDGDVNIWLYCLYDNGLSYSHLIKDFGTELFATEEEAEKIVKEER